MNNEQKQSIKDLRSRGFSYARIAEEVGVSANTFKSFCRRTDARQRLCKNCGKPLNEAVKRKPRTFCCDTCRQSWWRAHSDSLCKKAVYSYICENCHQPFESYGNKNRKFCSRGCYFANRYGVP